MEIRPCLLVFEKPMLNMVTRTYSLVNVEYYKIMKNYQGQFYSAVDLAEIAQVYNKKRSMCTSWFNAGSRIIENNLGEVLFFYF